MNKLTAIVTGAAKGIGRAIAQRLADDGWFTIIVDVDEAGGSEAVSTIGNDKSTFIKCDISSEDDVNKLFSKVVADRKQIDALVNNAGIIRDNMIWKMPVEDFDKVIEVNLKGAWLMCREAAKAMREQKSGRIVNISSRAWMGNPGQSNYSASKAGIVGLTRVLALELGRYGVNVNAVAPGLIDTPLTQALPEDVLQKLIEKQPTRKIGTPENIASTVAFLLSPDSDFITGQVLHVDGGRSI